MAVDHYENFPVASFLLPRRLVPAVEAIYAFARSADDLADEGDAAPEDRLAALGAYERELDVIAAGGTPEDPALLDYCNRSDNPVGKLMLSLYEADDALNVRDSDAICTALQLINFWQDVAIDLAKGRIYLPQEDLARHGVSERALQAGSLDGGWRPLMRFEVERARALMLSGAPLARRLPGRIGWELRMMIQGGMRILDGIEAADYDVFRRRPVLKAPDWLAIGWRALRM